MNKIKFLEASSFYKNYLEGFYSVNPELKTKSYNEQYNTLMNDCFSWADFWKLNLEKTDLYKAQKVIINAEFQQKKWAKDNNISFSNNNWVLEILEAQIAKFKPDIFFAHDFAYITPGFRKKIKKKFPSIKLILAWDGIAKNNPVIFEGCDLMLSCLEFVTDFYKQARFKTFFFPLCFEKSILKKVKKREALYNLSFCGSISLKNHISRLKILAELLRKTKINIWASSLDNDWRLYSKNQIKRLLNGNLQMYFDLWKIGRQNMGEAFGLKMYQTLSDSKITFNNHADSTKMTAGNMRLFEATGVGTCLLTDWRDNLKNYFEPEIEVVTYKSIGECIDKTKYLLNNENKRKQIAVAGQKKTLENYTYEKRIKQFSDYLLSII